MEFVGDAVKDHIITTGRKNDVVVIGMATWGCVANRHALDGDEVGIDFLVVLSCPCNQYLVIMSCLAPNHKKEFEK